MIAYAFAESAVTFVLLWVIWAAGQTFRSGTLSAWIYDSSKNTLTRLSMHESRVEGGWPDS